MKKTVTVIAMLLAFALVLAGCSGGDSSSAPAASTGGASSQADAGDSSLPESGGSDAAALTVAGINLQEDQFSSWCALGYKAACADYGVTMLHAISGGDLAKESELLNTYATQQVDGIAIMPASETSSMETLKQIHANYDMPITLLNVSETDDYSEFATGGATTSHDSLGRPSGEAAAEYIKNELGGEAKIGVITFKSQYPEPAAGRMDGFLNAVRAVNPNVELVAEAEAWVQDMAIQAAGDMITANPDLDVIFACNDGGTVGTVMAVKNAGKADQIKVFGIDGGEQQIEMLRSEDNILQAVTAQDAFGMGYRTMEILIQSLRGEYTGTVGEIEVLPGTLITRDNPASIDDYEKILLESK